MTFHLRQSKRTPSADFVRLACVRRGGFPDKRAADSPTPGGYEAPTSCNPASLLIGESQGQAFMEKPASVPGSA